jgi:hypothetical protein
MIEYVPIQAVLDPAYFPRTLRQELDDNTLLSHALDGWRMLNINQKLEEIDVIKPLANHTAEFPKDAKIVNLVTYTPCDDLTYDPTKYTTDNFLHVPLRFVGNTKINMSYDNYVGGSNTCQVCQHQELNACSETWALSIFKEFTCSIKQGLICFNYWREALSETGEILIIKNPLVLRYLGLYMMTMVFRDRAASMEANTNNMYRQYLQECEMAYKRVKGSFYQAGIDLSIIDSVTGTNTVNQRLMRSATTIYNKRDS